ncbi:MAG: hypothetical protein AAF961_08955, partial [Planctomycetota bacterium]
MQDALAELGAATSPSPGSPRSRQMAPPPAAGGDALPGYLVSSGGGSTPSDADRQAEESSTSSSEPLSLDLSEALLRKSKVDVTPTPKPRNAENLDERVSTASPPPEIAPRVAQSPATPRDDSADRKKSTSRPSQDLGDALDRWAERDAPESPPKPMRTAADAIPEEKNRLRSNVAADDWPTATDQHAWNAAGASPGRNAGQRKAESSSSVLLRSRQPIISSRVEGPRKVVVGQAAAYRIELSNSGQAPARELNTTIAVPQWAEVVGATAPGGRVDIQAAANEGASHTVQWHLYELAPAERQSLTLRLVPRQGRGIKLGVHWSHAPVGSETLVEVQEPKLKVELNGPEEVLYGKPYRYRLTLSNPGDGLAEGVELLLTPPGSDVGDAIQHTVGNVAPGQTKSIELELTPRDAGLLEIKAQALAAGGLESLAVKQIQCQRPELQVDWRGPERKYSGAVATYYLRVRNPGTAATGAVEVKLDLPAGVEFIGASEGHAFDAATAQLVWRSGGLNPEEERFMQLQCRLRHPGAARLNLEAQTRDGDLTDAELIHTEVIALADLKMEVSDPKGPIAVGEEATYEVTIRNRGTTAANGVEAVALFSEGIDPTAVDGGRHTINDGRVSFQPIASLAAGDKVTLRIKATASAPGTHVFRAE